MSICDTCFLVLSPSIAKAAGVEDVKSKDCVICQAAAIKLNLSKTRKKKRDRITGDPMEEIVHRLKKNIKEFTPLEHLKLLGVGLIVSTMLVGIGTLISTVAFLGFSYLLGTLFTIARDAFKDFKEEHFG